MKNPRFMKIGEDIYDVVYVKGYKDDGLCDVEKKEIKIRQNSRSSITNELVKIFHESFHGVADHFLLTGLLRKKQDEKLLDDAVEAAARGTVMLMMDNTEFFEEALSEIKKLKRRGTWRRSKSLRRNK